MKKALQMIFIVLVILGFGTACTPFKPAVPLKNVPPVAASPKEEQPKVVTNFVECMQAGNPIMESYPRQCRSASQTFTEYIGNELEKTDLIRIDNPRPNTFIKSPLTIIGQARGNWFFEASFPVFLKDVDGAILAQGIATAKSDPSQNGGAGWMTTEFVPYEATLTFTIDKKVYSNIGTLILKKDNPSGLPEFDDELIVPVIFVDFIEMIYWPPVSNPLVNGCTIAPEITARDNVLSQKINSIFCCLVFTYRSRAPKTVGKN